MKEGAMKVGELARRTGVSVRALHHYDQIGLLSPSQHTPSGHRLYTSRDIARLQQIKSLQQLGFSLEEVSACLDRPSFSPLRVIEQHLNLLSEQIDTQQRLRRRLQALATHLRCAEEATVEELLETIQEVSMMEKYFTPEQVEQLKARRELLGEERIRQSQAEWKELLERFRVEMEKGTDPAGDPVQALARQAVGLIKEFSGGDTGIERSVGRMYREEGASHLMEQHGWNVDQSVFDYMGRAMGVLRSRQ